MADHDNFSKRKFIDLDKDSVRKLLLKRSGKITTIPLDSKSKFKDFKRIRIDSVDTHYVTCSKCDDNNLIKYDSSTGAKGISYHLDVHKKDTNRNQLSMESFLLKPCKATDKEKVSIAAAKMCALDMRPFTMVEGDGMVLFVDTIIDVATTTGRVSAEQLLPCADTVKNHITKMAINVRTLIKSLLANVPYINCTSDHWMETDSNIEYMTVTIHYVNPNTLQLVNRVIGTFAVKDKTISSNQANFTKVLQDYDIADKIRIVVTDNASSMKNSFDNYDWIGCSAHDLALAQKWAFNQQKPKVIPDPVKSITSLMDTVKSLVTLVKKSGVNATLETKLRQSVETRWDTNYDMLKSVLDNIDELENEPSLRSLMDDIKRGVLIELCNLLKPFKDMRTALCADNRPTMHTVILSYRSLIQHIESFSSKTIGIIALKSRLKTYLQEKFHIKPLHVIATFLYPKYRSTKVTTADKDLEEKASDKLKLLLEEIDESDNEENTKVPYYDNQPDPIDNLFAAYAEKPTVSNSKVDDEIDEYKRVNLCQRDFNSDFCPFKFWFERKDMLPKLSSIAMWLLSAPATSCCSERNFSAAGFLYDHRNRLLPQTVDDLLLLKSNRDLMKDYDGK